MTAADLGLTLSFSRLRYRNEAAAAFPEIILDLGAEPRNLGGGAPGFGGAAGRHEGRPSSPGLVGQRGENVLLLNVKHQWSEEANESLVCTCRF